MKLTMLRIFFAAAVLVVSASATIIDNFNSPADQYVCVQTAPSGPPCGGVSAQNNNPAMVWVQTQLVAGGTWRHPLPAVRVTFKLTSTGAQPAESSRFPRALSQILL